MQRNGINGKKVIVEILPIILLVLLILLDQITKTYVKNLSETTAWDKTVVISNFFELKYTFNTGAAFSFLSNVTWGQLFFKILTPVCLVLFFIYYLFICKKDYKWARYALIFIFAGTIGNFIDRLYYDGVVDFIGFIFGDYHFPIFNLADVFMTIGVIMIIIHFLFLDNGGIFRKKKHV